MTDTPSREASRAANELYGQIKKALNSPGIVVSWGLTIDRHMRERAPDVGQAARAFLHRVMTNEKRVVFLTMGERIREPGIAECVTRGWVEHGDGGYIATEAGREEYAYQAAVAESERATKNTETGAARLVDTAFMRTIAECGVLPLNAWENTPEAKEAMERGWVILIGGNIRLTEEGQERVEKAGPTDTELARSGFMTALMPAGCLPRGAWHGTKDAGYAEMRGFVVLGEDGCYRATDAGRRAWDRFAPQHDTATPAPNDTFETDDERVEVKRGSVVSACAGHLWWSVLDVYENRDGSGERIATLEREDEQGQKHTTWSYAALLDVDPNRG